MKFGKKIGSQAGKTLSKAKKHIWRLLFLIAIGFGAFLISRPVMSIIKTRSEISELEKQKAIYEEIILQDSLFIESLENDEILEQYAREKYFMQGKNEQVFVVE